MHSNFFSYVKQFPKLETLSASHNRLLGEILNLKSLKVLSLTNNYFTGEIPCFPNKEMKVLELGANYFSVTIPKCIGDLSALNVLDRVIITLIHNLFLMF
uniref:Uncharacterized protein n=1 Tax=viral metagenome TaxID=1070528 RepID=A0A6C0JQH0_9ZZZZ